VWWVTLIDKSLEATAPYRSVVVKGEYISNTLHGLRSVRNRIGHEVNITDFVDFYRSVDTDGSASYRALRWRPVAPPSDQRRSALENHQAYVSTLAGQHIFESFSVAARYLRGIADVIHPPQI
jgi:hypothetical protein